jgi:hypothetical protein
VRLIRRTDRALVFLLKASELQMLGLVLSQFPLRDQDQQISRFGDDEDLKGAQQLLNEAMAERRKEARSELQAWLRSADRFTHTDHGEELLVHHDETEWLLQILNNVRVGAWQRLGEPEDLADASRSATAESIRYLTVMEMAGGFQSALFFDE